MVLRKKFMSTSINFLDHIIKKYSIIWHYFFIKKMKHENEKKWMLISLASAVRCTKDEPDLYTLADLKVKYS